MNKKQILGNTFKLSLIAIGSIAAFGAVALAQTATSTNPLTNNINNPVCTLSAYPSAIAPGASSTLSWYSTDTTIVTFDQGLGSTTPSSIGIGSILVAPATTTTYTGTFVGAGGTTTCEATVSVGGAPTTSTTTISPPRSSSSTITTDSTTTSSSATPAPYPAIDSTPAPMVIEIDNAGNMLIRGTVATVSPYSMTINTWGGVWTIRTNGVVTVVPPSITMGDLSNIQPGDFVGVEGFADQNNSYTVDATLVRDWTSMPLTTASTNEILSSTTDNTETGGTSSTSTTY